MNKYTRKGKQKIDVENRIGARKIRVLDLVDTKQFVVGVNGDSRANPGSWYLHVISRSNDGQLWVMDQGDVERDRLVKEIAISPGVPGHKIDTGSEHDFLDAIPEGECFTLVIQDCEWFIVGHEDALTVPREQA